MSTILYSANQMMMNVCFSGAHCLDLRAANETDPEWLVEQRNKEIEIIKGWITQYYADLRALKWTSKLQSKP